MMNFIDAHSHIWTPDTERYPLAPGFRRALMDPPRFTPAELCQQAIPVGVGRVVLIQMSFYGYDNSYMLHALSKYPEVYRGVAVIDPCQENVATLMQDLKQKGVRGFRIYPKNEPVDRWLSFEGMRAMWKCGGEQNLAMCCLMDADGLSELDRMCRQFPDTPVVIDHLCRIGVTGQILEQDVKSLCDMAKHQKLTVKVSGFYALGQKEPPYHDLVPMIKRLCDAFGRERLMWGSDSPFQVVNGHSYKASIDLVHSKLDFLKPAGLEWLLKKTAEKVFFY
jgi:predicted TIM-barrel fold metal-dependent hydrolase